MVFSSFVSTRPLLRRLKDFLHLSKTFRSVRMPRVIDGAVVSFGLLLAITVPLQYGIAFLITALITQLLGAAYYRYYGKQPVPAKAAVMITGCSTGIGKAAAIHLSKQGFTVFAGVRLEEIKEEMEC